MRFKVLALLLAVGLVAGCSVTSQATDWAGKAVERSWTAEYRILFHQSDGDIEMTVQESRDSTLLFDIAMPSGTLRLEYDDENLLINLDQGNLEWEDFSRQPPYYSLGELARLIAAQATLNSDGDWVIIEGYSLKMEQGIPTQVKWGIEWTLFVDNFKWN